MSDSGIHDRNYTSSLFSAHHTFIDMRKNMRKRYEKKRGAYQGREREKERQNKYWRQDGQIATSQISMVALAFSSNTASHPICIQGHFFKMLDQPWSQPSSLQLPGPWYKMDR